MFRVWGLGVQGEDEPEPEHEQRSQETLEF